MEHNNSNPPSEVRSQSPVPLEVNSTRMSSFSSAHYMHHHGTATRLPNPPTFVEWDGMRFLIMDAPSDSNIDLYLRELKRYGVTDLVRVCDPTYARERVEEQGISVHEMLFPDGDAPSDSVVSAWMSLVDSRFGHPTTTTATTTAVATTGGGNSEEALNKDPATIAVHCVAGLGRAPALVAIALIEAGMSPLDAVAFLRERRRGAINNKQLRYLESYRRRSRSDRCLLM